MLREYRIENTVKKVKKKKKKGEKGKVCYAGRLEIGGTPFKWEADFDNPIWTIDQNSIEPNIDLTTLKPILGHIRIWQGGVKITLKDEEYRFFLNLLVRLVVNFYCNPLLCTANYRDRFFWESIRKEAAKGIALTKAQKEKLRLAGANGFSVCIVTDCLCDLLRRRFDCLFDFSKDPWGET